MINNPLELRLAKLNDWQLKTFMVCLCERMYPNYALFCQQTAFTDPKQFKWILNLVWESLLVKEAKINFDYQLDKLGKLIPESNCFPCYGVYPAMDACEALSELLHVYLSNNAVEHARHISAISIKTIADLEQFERDKCYTVDELKNRPNIVNELDIQWEIYRLLKGKSAVNLELIKGLKKDLEESRMSNLGLFLNN